MFDPEQCYSLVKFDPSDDDHDPLVRHVQLYVPCTCLSSWAKF